MKIVKASELGEAAINKLLQKPAFDEPARAFLYVFQV